MRLDLYSEENFRKDNFLKFSDSKFPGLSMGMGFPWKSHGKYPMGWDSTHCISHGIYGTEIDEQEIENLLNEHRDSEYECQNDNEL